MGSSLAICGGWAQPPGSATPRSQGNVRWTCMNASPKKGHDETPKGKQNRKSHNGTIPTLFKILIYL